MSCPRIEPRKTACQADVLTTTMSRISTTLPRWVQCAQLNPAGQGERMWFCDECFSIYKYCPMEWCLDVSSNQRHVVVIAKCSCRLATVEEWPKYNLNESLMTFLVLQCCPGKLRKRSWQSLCSFVYGNDHKCIKWAFLIGWKSHEWDKCPCFESADYRFQMCELLIMSDFQKKPFVIHEWPQIKCC